MRYAFVNTEEQASEGPLGREPSREKPRKAIEGSSFTATRLVSAGEDDFHGRFTQDITCEWMVINRNARIYLIASREYYCGSDFAGSRYLGRLVEWRNRDTGRT